ncbi:MAG: NAD(P)H-dependent oxidoreductase [Terricaulis sp.]
MSDKVLIIDGHPDPDRARYCHALCEAYGDGARSTGHQVRVVTVAEIDAAPLRNAKEFGGAPDSVGVLQARADIRWCNHLVLVFPLWMGGPPAHLHAFLEQIARQNFVAEATPAGLHQKLRGRSARLIVTMAMPAFAYRLMFHEHGVRSVMRSILGFGGVAPVRRTYLGAIEAVSSEERTKRLAQVKELGKRAQ